MAITEDQAYSLLVRQKKLNERIDEMYRTINGGNAHMEDVVAADGTYNNNAVRGFASDVLRAYNALIYSTHLLEFPDETTEELLESSDWTQEEIDEYFERGTPISLDDDQKIFLENLVYCMARLVAESPFYDGMFGELARDCGNMLGMLKHGPTFDEFVAGVARRQKREGAREACTPKALMDRRQPYTVTYSMFPLVFWAGSEWPEGAFIPDLDAIYEVLGGKPIDALATKTQIRQAVRNGAVDGVEELDNMPDENEPLDDFALKFIKDQEAVRVAEAKNIERWVEQFPNKRAWCKAYEEMCKAYFRLGGLKPHSTDFDRDKWVEAVEISVDQVDYAFAVVLDDRRFSHFTDDIYEDLYDEISTAIARARRRVMQRRLP